MKNHMIQKIKRLSSKYNLNPCIKQTVYAMIKTIDGQEVFGSNSISNNIVFCPRELGNYKSGEGYHLCKEICKQEFHVEVDAIKNAKKLQKLYRIKK